MQKPELLSPCSTFESVKAAVYAGADAVYFGLKKFNARMYAKNLDNDSLNSVVEFCHSNGVKVYVTMNTLILDREMEEAINQAIFIYNSGVDALIVADLGFAALLHKILPEFELHASTQTSGDNHLSASELQKIGFKRMVASRELSRENLKTICASSPIEIEMFIHGAICASHSGQCLLSSFIGGRSGNRGECAQPCRLPYNNRYPISFKDMCLASHIKEIIDIAPQSLKIEGRMKSASYIYSVTRIYRILIDENRNATSNEIKFLASVFSRSGFTDGYFCGKLDSEMLGIRTESDKENSNTNKIVFKKYERNLSPIVIDRKKAEFISYLPEKKFNTKKTRSARFLFPENIPETDFFDIIYLPFERFDGKKANGVVLPPFLTDSELNIKEKLKEQIKNGLEHVLISNLGQLEILDGLGLQIHIDYRLNIFNSETAMLFSDYCDYIASPELNLPQIRDLAGNKSVIVYGHVPVMLLEKKVGAKRLCDRRHVTFNIVEENGRDVLLNSVPFYMADKQKELKRNCVFNQHFIFTSESEKEVSEIIDSYKFEKTTNKNIKRIK